MPQPVTTGPVVLPVGDPATRVWSMTSAERVRRIARAQGLGVVDRPAASGATLVVDLGHAFDPLWLRTMTARPGEVLTKGGRTVIAHATDAATARAAAAAITAGAAAPAGLAALPVEAGIDVHNEELRKREAPFLLPLEPGTVEAIERASYRGAYKGVTDLLTKYLWPELAFHLTRLAAKLGLSPNAVTTIGFAFCVAAFLALFEGWYWSGLALGFVFMVLDTVDGKLARCTITSSKWGDVFDHGTDLVHPPFWWWAWVEGLERYGRPLDPDLYWPVLAVVIGGYVAGRLVEGAFMQRFGMHIHVWRPIDSRFRLVTARRNPNVVLLAGALLFGRPDIGILLVAGWTLVSVAFHLVRWVQAELERARSAPVVSWLA